MGTILDLANQFLGGGRSSSSSGSGGTPRSYSGGYSSSDYGGRSGGLFQRQGSTSQLPNLKQLLPGADRNFGVEQGEGGDEALNY